VFSNVVSVSMNAAAAANLRETCVLFDRAVTRWPESPTVRNALNVPVRHLRAAAMALP
jgi:hypothetical protein